MDKSEEERSPLSCRQLFLLLIVVGLKYSTPVWSADQKLDHDFPRAGKSNLQDHTNVTLQIKHGISLPWGKPGFRVLIGNWIPNGELSIAAIGPDGKRIDMATKELQLKADDAGNALVDIDYERKGLRRGHWIFVVAGKLGVHVIETDMPSIEPPSKERNSWKLNF